MGGNRRYPGHAEHLVQQRELRAASARGRLATLSDEQLSLSSQPLTVVPELTKIYASVWVRFGDTDVHITARVRRWTSRAVGVEFKIDETVRRCWVWHGACGPFRDER